VTPLEINLFAPANIKQLSIYQACVPKPRSGIARVVERSEEESARAIRLAEPLIDSFLRFECLVKFRVARDSDGNDPTPTCRACAKQSATGYPKGP